MECPKQPVDARACRYDEYAGRMETKRICWDEVDMPIYPSTYIGYVPMMLLPVPCFSPGSSEDEGEKQFTIFYNMPLLAFSLLCLYFILFVLTHSHRLDHPIPLLSLTLLISRSHNHSRPSFSLSTSLMAQNPSRSCFLFLVVSRKSPFRTGLLWYISQIWCSFICRCSFWLQFLEYLFVSLLIGLSCHCCFFVYSRCFEGVLTMGKEKGIRIDWYVHYSRIP